MEQLPITEMFAEPTKSRFYLLTAVLHVDGGLAFGGHEWHEKYIAKMPVGEVNDLQLLDALSGTHGFKRATVIETGGGPRIKIGNATIFFTRTQIAPMLAKQIIDQKILPLMNVSKIMGYAA